MKKKLTAFFKGPFGKGLLEALRWGVLAFVSVVVTELLKLVPTLEADSVWAVYGTLALRFLDATLHKTGVAEKGLTRF